MTELSHGAVTQGYTGGDQGSDWSEVQVPRPLLDLLTGQHFGGGPATRVFAGPCAGTPPGPENSSWGKPLNKAEGLAIATHFVDEQTSALGTRV